MKRKQGINPFYVLLAVVGMAFVVTAFAHGLMAFNSVHPLPVTSDSSVIQNPDHPLWKLLERHGNRLLLWEVALLAVFTVAAIATDEFWTSRARRQAAGLDDLSNQTKPVDTPQRSTRE